jgi:thiol-disulfide isomerase/thioredoxin
MVMKGLLCSFLVLLSGCGVGEKETEVVAVGSLAPDFTLRSLDGATVTGQSLKGQAVVLNFWATWCGPCLKEIPDLKQVASETGAKVIGIALDEDGVKAVKPFVLQHGINYTVLLGNQEVFEQFHGMGIPYTLVLDGERRVIRIYRGTTTREALEQDLKTINRGA